MRHRIQISEPAEEDLNDIWDYIANRSPANADRYLDRIKRRLQRIAENPRALGNPRDHLHPGLRGAIEGSHIIFYTVAPKHIEVIRVLHQKQDHPSYFD